MGFVEGIVKVVKKVKKVVKDTADDLLDKAEELKEDIKDTISDGYTDLKNKLKHGTVIGAVIAFASAVAVAAIEISGEVVNFMVGVSGILAGGLIKIAGVVIGLAVAVVITVLTLGSARDFAFEAGEAIADFFGMLGDGVQKVSYVIGDILQGAFDFAGSYVASVLNNVRCSWFGPKLKIQDGPKHIIVLMLENRSFDHMLGLCGIPNVDGINSIRDFNWYGDTKHRAQKEAKLAISADPPHLFNDVQDQLKFSDDIPNSGFVESFARSMADIPAGDREHPAEVMKAFTPEKLPILNFLAKEFAVCDRWFSSIPGPTVPNRLFVHAATSGGLAGEPSPVAIASAMTVGPYEFKHGTIFQSLDARCIPWRVYAGDALPLVAMLKGMTPTAGFQSGTKIRGMSEFGHDLQEEGNKFPNYVFIEPDYGAWWSDFQGGNSQHPTDSVVAGEILIKETYERLRASTIWNESALIIVYDEHGGFYDHVIPPETEPPRDGKHYADWSDEIPSRSFKFDKLGVRVPAVIVSPLIEKGTVTGTRDGKIFDHASVVSTLAEIFSLSKLTDRGRWASSLNHLFTLDSPRDTPERVPDPYE